MSSDSSQPLDVTNGWDATEDTGMVRAISAASTASVGQSTAYRIRIKMSAVSLAVGLLLTALFHPITLHSLSLSWGLILGGWSLFFLGAGIRIWSSSYICARKSLDVVRTGPYSLCRNPLYWGTFLMVSALPLLIKSPILATAMIPSVLLYVFAVVPAEESVMLKRHGADYIAYCDSVSRWMPHFHRYEKGTPLDGQSFGYFKECTRMFWWIGLTGGIQLLFSRFHNSWWLFPS